MNVSQLAKELGIEKPIMSYDLVDKTIRIHLYGGETIIHQLTTPTNAPTPDADIIANPQMFSRDQLRPVAARLGIEGADDMNKRPLVKAIKKWKVNHLTKLDKPPF